MFVKDWNKVILSKHIAQRSFSMEKHQTEFPKYWEPVPGLYLQDIDIMALSMVALLLLGTSIYGWFQIVKLILNFVIGLF